MTTCRARKAVCVEEKARISSRCCCSGSHTHLTGPGRGGRAVPRVGVPTGADDLPWSETAARQGKACFLALKQRLSSHRRSTFRTVLESDVTSLTKAFDSMHNENSRAWKRTGESPSRPG